MNGLEAFTTSKEVFTESRVGEARKYYPIEVGPPTCTIPPTDEPPYLVSAAVHGMWSYYRFNPDTGYGFSSPDPDPDRVLAAQERWDTDLLAYRELLERINGQYWTHSQDPVTYPEPVGPIFVKPPLVIQWAHPDVPVTLTHLIPPGRTIPPELVYYYYMMAASPPALGDPTPAYVNATQALWRFVAGVFHIHAPLRDGQPCLLFSDYRFIRLRGASVYWQEPDGFGQIEIFDIEPPEPPFGFYGMRWDIDNEHMQPNRQSIGFVRNERWLAMLRVNLEYGLDDLARAVNNENR